MEASTSSARIGRGANRSGFIAGIRAPLLRHQADARLLELTRQGSDSAFETLFNRYRNRLIAFAYQLLGTSSTDAEDVVQEVMLAAHHAMVADERAIEVRPWLYKITRNRCLNHLRDQAAARRPPINGDGHDQELLERAASNGPSAEEQAGKKAELRLLVDDVCSLPEAQRTALVLREIDGLSYQEVAEAMNTSVSSIKSLLVRARLGLVDIAEGRELSCEDLRISLALAEQKLGGLTGAERAHLRGCERCSEVRDRLRGTSRSLAALAPIGLLGAAQDALASAGTASAVGGGAAAVSGGGAAAVGTGGATAGGLLAGGGLAIKGVVTVLAVGAIAAGGTYLPGAGKDDSADAGVPAAPAAPASTFNGAVTAPTQPAHRDQGTAAKADAVRGAATVTSTSVATAAAEVIDDDSAAAAAVAESRTHGSDPAVDESRIRGHESVTPTEVPVIPTDTVANEPTTAGTDSGPEPATPASATGQPAASGDAGSSVPAEPAPSPGAASQPSE